MKILIVDDNGEDRKVLGYYLKSQKNEVIEAEDGQKGLALAEIHRPDLIISDAMMPVMDGFQFLRNIKKDEILNSIPFIFYSAVYTGQKEVELALSLGAEAYIIKPKSPDEFWGELNAAIEDSKLKKKKVKKELIEEEEEFLKKYSHIVVRKLEEKVKELEKAKIEKEKSEISYQHLFNSMRDVIIIADMERYILDTNQPALREMFGYEIEDVKGKKARMLYADDESFNLAGRQIFDIKEFIEGRIFEVDLQRKNGEIFKGELYALKLIGDMGMPSGNIGVVRDITERKRAEDQLRGSREELRALAAHLQSVREEERGRIALEIHDELGQSLTVLKMDSSWLVKRLPENQKLLIEKTESMLKLIGDTIHKVRKISNDLRPGVLDNLGIIAAIEWQAKEFQGRSGTKCELNLIPEDIDLEGERSTAVFRIFQETLTNIARHANATEVNISLVQEAGNLTLKVEDNGRGIKKEEISNPKSLGLLGMRERAILFGGEMKIIGLPGKGTTVTLRIPLLKTDRKVLEK